MTVKVSSTPRKPCVVMHSYVVFPLFFCDSEFNSFVFSRSLSLNHISFNEWIVIGIDLFSCDLELIKSLSQKNKVCFLNIFTKLTWDLKKTKKTNLLTQERTSVPYWKADRFQWDMTIYYFWNINSNIKPLHFARISIFLPPRGEVSRTSQPIKDGIIRPDWLEQLYNEAKTFATTWSVVKRQTNN